MDGSQNRSPELAGQRGALTPELAQQGGARSAIAASMRSAAPECAAWVDAMRAVFGPGVRVRYVREGEVSAGRPGEQGVEAVRRVTTGAEAGLERVITRQDASGGLG